MGFSIIKHHKASKYWGTHWNLHVDFRHLRKSISCCKAEAEISSLLHEQIDFRHHDITAVFPHSHQYFHCVLLGRACQCLFCPCWHEQLVLCYWSAHQSIVRSFVLPSIWTRHGLKQSAACAACAALEARISCLSSPSLMCTRQDMTWYVT